MEFGYKKLDVWKQSIDLAKIIINLNKELDKNLQYTLGSQMLRSAISVSSNIAEGVSRSSNQEKIRFLNISYASLMECNSQCELLRENFQGLMIKLDFLFEQIAFKLIGLSDFYKKEAQDRV